MSYTDRLRRLAIHGVDSAQQHGAGQEPVSLDPKSLALGRIAALVAIGGPMSSYGELVDAAVSADASPDDCVDVLVDIVGIVGVPRIVAAAPRLALALGQDIEVGLEDPRFGEPPSSPTSVARSTASVRDPTSSLR